MLTRFLRQKESSHLYEPGKRTGSWVKCRVNRGQELVIGGYIPGPHGFDSLIVGYYRGKDLVYVARGRNGFVPASRRQVFEKIRHLVSPTMAFVNLPDQVTAFTRQSATIIKANCTWGSIWYAFAIMKASLLYRIASILLLLFAVGHTLGFRRVDPESGIDSLIGSMRSIRFNANGFERTYWDFFVGFGLFVSVLMVFAAVIAWQLGGHAPSTLAVMRISAWGFVVCFASVAYLSWRYFFTVPVIFSVAILLCLVVAAWVSGKPN